jgi:hypothetical protein
MTAKLVAAYLRVSTKNHGQNLNTQRLALQEYARNRGFDVVAEYADRGVSGSKDRRPEHDRLMKDARARKFDAVLVARFDRFARSTKHLVTALEEFGALGHRLHFVVGKRRHKHTHGKDDLYRAWRRCGTGAESDQGTYPDGPGPRTQCNPQPSVSNAMCSCWVSTPSVHLSRQTATRVDTQKTDLSTYEKHADAM